MGEPAGTHIRPDMAEGRTSGEVRGSASILNLRLARRSGRLPPWLRDQSGAQLRRNRTPGVRPCSSSACGKRISGSRRGGDRGRGPCTEACPSTWNRDQAKCFQAPRMTAVACVEPVPPRPSAQPGRGTSVRLYRLPAVRCPAAPPCRERTTPPARFLRADGRARSAGSGCWPRG